MSDTGKHKKIKNSMSKDTDKALEEEKIQEFQQMIYQKLENANNGETTPNTKKAQENKRNEYRENVRASGNQLRHEAEDRHHKKGDDHKGHEKDSRIVEAKPLKDELGESFYEDSDSSEDEGLPDYKIGGYHPVHVGEVFKERYVVIQKLGWGHFSTVWLAKDKKYNTYVALKVQKSAQHYIEAAYDEVQILDQVSSFWRKKEWQESLKHYYKDDPKKLKEIENSSKYCHTVQLLNAFLHHGPNGTHYVMVFEILGVNLLEIIKRYDYKGVPLHLVRELTKQCLVGLDYMSRICKLIHTDLKPENVVITLTKNELKGIKEKGVLKTTKMYHQDEDQIARIVAGAHDNIILSSRAEKEETKAVHKDSISITDAHSKDWNEMTAKEKKNYRKNKRKRIKKYITQGKLPENYDDLEKEQKEALYAEVRSQIEQENLKREANLEAKKEHDHKEKETEIEIDSKDIEISQLETTGMTKTEKNEPASKEAEEEKPEIKQPQDEKNDSVKKKSSKKKAKAFRHSSAPRNNGDDLDEGDLKELEKLQQLMGEGMDDAPSHLNIPKLNTHLIKDDQKTKDKLTKRGPKIDEDVNLAIVDMGNGCWTHHHFTSQIQTRQYRSPETIIGVPYGPSADIWSLACMVFELLTGDFLFEPRKGYYYDQDDDHLAQMIELLGRMPKNFALSGKNSKRFFDSTGHLRKIRGLNYWPLQRVLTEKYRFVPKEADALADFLQCMLAWYPEKRATAQEMLEHPWLKMPRNDEFKMEAQEYEKMMEEIKKKEEAEKIKRELEVILREGSMEPEILSKKIRSENMSELAESNFEKNAADIEDLTFSDIDAEPVHDDEDSITLGYDGTETDDDEHYIPRDNSFDLDPDADTLIKPAKEKYNLFVGGGYGKGKPLNNSFTGPYNNMDHIHIDRGANKQFD
ncbi:unnamed protein product [Moneuplotes crassus]|uniref:non-specific serine/threonine protein kinase n=2 Tax=Euplotes crassus TaxID=5936 RepID=A0AAD2D688_EUPCR|nr:unnamed protein product [Moneuplotes crassus]